MQPYTTVVVIRIQKHLRGYLFRIREIRGNWSAERHVTCRNFIHEQVKYVTFERTRRTLYKCIDALYNVDVLILITYNNVRSRAFSCTELITPGRSKLRRLPSVSLLRESFSPHCRTKIVLVLLLLFVTRANLYSTRGRWISYQRVKHNTVLCGGGRGWFITESAAAASTPAVEKSVRSVEPIMFRLRCTRSSRGARFEKRMWVCRGAALGDPIGKLAAAANRAISTAHRFVARLYRPSFLCGGGRRVQINSQFAMAMMIMTESWCWRWPRWPQT